MTHTMICKELNCYWQWIGVDLGKDFRYVPLVDTNGQLNIQRFNLWWIQKNVAGSFFVLASCVPSCLTDRWYLDRTMMKK